MKKALLFPFQIGLGTFGFFYPNSAQAQVTSDFTVNTQVNQNGNVAEITGGETRGSNLFHSFQDFSVLTGNEAFFNNANDIANIFSRVTGGNISNIDGAIRANGSASLFLINPAGIIFGENARLNIGGSFYGSTASSVLFEDGGFSAADLENPPLLTVNAPIGFGFRDNPGDIENNNVDLRVVTGETITLLGGDISLNGGNLTAPEGNIQLGSVAESGIINLQESSPGLMLIYETIENFGDIQLTNNALVNVDGQQGGTVDLQGDLISLLDGSQITSSNSGSDGGNDITLTTQKLLIQDNARILTSTLGQGAGGDINVTASDSVELTGTGFEDFQQNFILSGLNGTFNFSTPGTGLLTGTFGSGQSGQINLNTSSLKLQDGAYIFSPTLGIGNSGNISVSANQIDIIGSSIASVALRGSTGFAGDINIDTDNLVVSDGSYILGSTLSSGNAGNIFIDASDSVEILRTPEGVIVQTGIFPSNLGGTGNSGNAEINTSKLIIRDGAGIASVSGGIFGGTVVSREGGSGGNISINATEFIEISGISEPLVDGTRIGSFISGQTTTDNPAGQLTIDTGKLIIKDGGLISAATLDAGDAGDLTINASESIEISGTALNSQFQSKIEASSGQAFSIEDISASGDAGNLNITTSNLSVKDGGSIITSTLGQGAGGDINVTASDSVELTGTGFEDFQQNFILSGLNGTFNFSTPGTGLLTGTFGSGQSGQINLNTSSLKLQDGAYIFSPTLGIGNSGNISVSANQIDIIGSSIASVALRGSTGFAGDINIDTDNLVVSDGSYILGSTLSSGNAGNIFIDASDSVEILRTPEGVIVQTGIFPSNLGGTGNSGNAEINTSKLIIRDGAGIASVSGGIFGGTVVSREGGSGGNISINATEFIEISGISEPLVDGTRIGSFISGQTTTDNPAGQLTIDTGKLIIKDGGLISAATLDAGDAGDLTINASESIEISGTALNSQFQSKIEASSGQAFSIEDISASGDAGNLNITTSNLSVKDGGSIITSTLGQGAGGDINITASDSLVLDNNASILAETAFTGGGNINLEIGKIFSLSNNSLLSAQALNNGNGGNLTIDSRFIIAFPDGNNDILASAEQGEGGNITINAESLFGIQERSPSNLTNDINASSETSGLDGTISIFTPDINPVQGATELPTNVVETEKITQQACEANREVAARNGLTISGKGGILPDPALPLNSLNVTVSEGNTSISTIPAPIETAQGRIQPARGVKVTDSGEVTLTAYRTNNLGDRIPETKNCA
ncbi:MAG: filamentous hemagglutinin N-terminal domain-containing protein [Cyanobacteria bacterium J06621_8]